MSLPVVKVNMLVLVVVSVMSLDMMMVMMSVMSRWVSVMLGSCLLTLLLLLSHWSL